MTETFEIDSIQNLGADDVRSAVRVPVGCVYFEGHFEGRPMLPGVAQVVGLGHQLAQRSFPGLGTPIRLLRAKFQAVVGPGDRLEVFLSREREGGEARVRVRVERAGETVSSATLVYSAV